MAATRTRAPKEATEAGERSERVSAEETPDTTPATTEETTTESLETPEPPEIPATETASEPAMDATAAPAPASTPVKAEGESLFPTPPPSSPFARKKAEVASTGVLAGNKWQAGVCFCCGGSVTGEDRYEDGRYTGCRYECAACGKAAASHQEIVRK